MVEEQICKENKGPGETHPPPLSAREFLDSPEFRRFRTGMKKLLKVSKTELDRRMEHAIQISPRTGNPRAPGRKRLA